MLALFIFLISQTASIHGTVNAADGNGQSFRIPAATLVLSADGVPIATVYSNEVGEYTFNDVRPGSYSLEATLQGFETFTQAVTVEAGETLLVEVHIRPAGVHEQLTVVGGSEGLQERQTAPPVEIKQQTIQQVPIANEHFQSALPLVPGVVRGPDGTLNVKGARESQSGLRVNSANVTDPVTGEFALRLPIEAIQSLRVVTSPYAPEYGQITGGMTTIETTAGTNEWKVQVQDLTPRLRRRDRQFRGLESWTPRVAVGGPIAPRLTLFESVEYQYTQTRVESLPPLQSDTKLESFSSFTQLDWTPTAEDHASMAVAVFPQKRSFLGLDTFNPQPVTPNLDQTGFLWTLNERRILSGSSLVAAHASVRQLDSDVSPNGSEPRMVLAPDQNSGSYFNTQRRNSRRYEALGEYLSTPAALGGSHTLKIGAGVGHDIFDGTTDSRPVIIVRADGSRAQQIDYAGPTTLSTTKTDTFAYAQDSWSAGRLTLDYGVHYDRDTISRTDHVAPRVGFSFAPVAGGATVIRGGAGLFYDKLTLNAVTFDELPGRVVTRYGRDGETVVGVPLVDQPEIDGRLRNPQSTTWNVEVDHEITRRLELRAGYQQRNGSRELIVDPRVDGGRGSLVLANEGRSRYRELELTGRYRAHGNQLVLSYIRSSAIGDLNDLGAFFGNIENPVIRANERSRLPFDAPNRILAWGEFDLPRGFGVAPLVEVRDGFPLSIFDENRDFVGRRNEAGRYPTFFSLDAQVWKHVTVPWPRKLNARLGIKVFNITDHFNPRDFDGNLASARFGGFSNGISRTFRGKFVIDF